LAAVAIQYAALLLERIISTQFSSISSAAAEHGFRYGLLVVFHALVAYGPPVGFCVYAARRWGSGGGRRNSLGFRFRPVDLGWGPLTWLCVLFGQIFVVLLIRATHIPLASNVPDLKRQALDSRFVWLAILAIVIAPLCEELLFRGVLFRAFRSRLALGWAAAAQGLLFGLAHVQPAFGMGNIGLVLMLTWVGTALGLAAEHFRRIWPGIIAHASLNGLAVLVLYIRTTNGDRPLRLSVG
jgi:membrane protease YdiL (CAAX protease family)